MISGGCIPSPQQRPCVWHHHHTNFCHNCGPVGVVEVHGSLEWRPSSSSSYLSSFRRAVVVYHFHHHHHHHHLGVALYRPIPSIQYHHLGNKGSWCHFHRHRNFTRYGCSHPTKTTTRHRTIVAIAIVIVIITTIVVRVVPSALRHHHHHHHHHHRDPLKKVKPPRTTTTTTIGMVREIIRTIIVQISITIIAPPKIQSIPIITVPNLENGIRQQRPNRS